MPGPFVANGSILRTLWGQGLATEAAHACRDYGITKWGKRIRVYAVTQR